MGFMDMTTEAAPLGQRIDTLFSLRREIDAAEAEVKKLKQLEAKFEKDLIEQFGKSELEGAAGSSAKAKLVARDHPSIEDREKFNAYVLENKALDLFHQRVSSTAWKARRDMGDEVPGLRVFTSISVKTSSISK